MLPRDVIALGAALTLLISAASLGWGWSWAALVMLVVIIYLYRRRKSVSRLARPAPPGDGDVLWADAEQALADLDWLADGGEFREQIIRLAWAGRRAVARGRQAPAEPAAAQTRHTLCLAADVLATYVRTDIQRRTLTAERMYDLLERSARAMEEYAEQLVADEGLCARLRVLENELQSMEPE